jgi:formylglycine-generating enzyme required for sulfatase activity
MAQPEEKTCSQCSKPLAPELHSDLCGSCHTALFSLAIDGPDRGSTELPNDTTATGLDTWSRLSNILPDREFVRELGRGGMGSVSLLRHKRLERFEALKILLPELSESPRFVKRFLRESKVLAQLRHPNIVTLYDCSEADGILYILMDYVDGGTLRAAISKRELETPQRLDIISQLATGLAYAHRNGVIHRDIKPANILLTQSGEVKIADFALCTQNETGSSQMSVTSPLDVMGTFGYMAPELQQGAIGTDARCDVYSLGVICYELFTQRLPQGVFRPPSTESNLSPQVDEVILKALEQDPESRYSDANEFLEAWQQVTDSAFCNQLPPQSKLKKTPVRSQENQSRRRLKRAASLAALVVLSIALVYNTFFAEPEINQASESKKIEKLEGLLPKDFIVPSIEMHLKWVPPARSIIGAMNAEDVDASPPLPIETSYGFWMGAYEVSQLQYVNLMGTNPSHFNANRTATDKSPDNPGDWRRRPVDSVTWRESSAFCEKLTTECRRSGMIPSNYRFRLPTEIEWELVCRAGDLSVESSNFKAEEIRAQAWTRDNFQDVEQTQEIGTKLPNAWGFYDMHGNVSDYCINGWWYYRDIKDQSIRDWVDHSELGDRIYRGGSFAQSLQSANVYKRSSNAIDERDLAQGFRVVLSEEFPFVTEMLDSELPNWFEVAPLGLRMTWIPSGEFQMGEDSPSTPRGPSVFPVTPTVISDGFWMSVTEVTEFQYARAEKGDLTWLLQEESVARDASQDLPAANVSWMEATNFCHKLTVALETAGRLHESFTVRLPTEAEWEWACRRGHATLFAFGDSPGNRFENRARHRDNGMNSPGPVGEKGAGQSGLRGMYGNVREWCLDWKHTYPGTPQTNPLGELNDFLGREKAIRGGDYLSEEALCTGTARTFATPEHKSKQVGFRIVLGRPSSIDAPPTPSPTNN